MSISENIAAVCERIARAARHAARTPGDIALMAVSKTHPPESIRDAYDAGQRLFGENRVQEFAAKAAALADLQSAQWHMIGHLQTNKAAKTVELFRAVDSVDSLKLAEKLDAAARNLGTNLDVLIEIKVGGESAKSGVAPNSPALEELLLAAPRLDALVFRGLMTVPPLPTIPKARGPISASCETYAIKLPPASCPLSPWTSFPWACRTISKSRLKRARPACASARRSSGKGQGHKNHEVS